MISVIGTLAQRQAEQAQVEHDRHAEKQAERQHVRRLDQRVHVERLVQRDAARTCPPATDKTAEETWGPRIIRACESIIGVLLCGGSCAPPHRLSAQRSRRGAAPTQPAGTMSELMVKIIYPASDAIFYITTREPKTEAEWGELQGKALAVAESANLLMMPGRARDQDRWMQDAKLMLDAGRAAFRAAQGEGRRGARRAQRSALHVVHQLPSALSPELRPAAGCACRRWTVGQARQVGRVQSVRQLGLAQRRTLPRPPTCPSCPSSKPTLEGRWKLRKAEDIRADGTVARYPWGEHPVGSIVVERGACYVQIMSSDTPSFPAGAAPPPSR